MIRHAIALLTALMITSHAALGVTEDEVSRAMQLAATYLVNAQRADGLFRYEFDFFDDEYSEKDNIVRQAGAGAVLAEYYQLTGEGQVVPTLRAALDGFAKSSLEYRDGRLVAGGDSHRTARSGATALALLTELRYQQRSGDGRFESARRAWRNGLLALRVPQGGFRKYPGTNEELSFFNGEIWLALAEYHSLFPNDTTLAETLRDVETILMARYGEKEKGGFFLWGLQAAEVRHASSTDDVFHHYAVSKTKFYLDTRRPKFRENAMHCASLEGLTSVLLALESSDSGDAQFADLKQRLADRVEQEVAKHLTFQIQPGQTMVRYGENVRLYSARLPEFAGAFLNGRRSTKTRIDFTWHCLSSLIKYKRVLQARRRHDERARSTGGRETASCAKCEPALVALVHGESARQCGTRHSVPASPVVSSAGAQGRLTSNVIM